jgi:adenosine kinase
MLKAPAPAATRSTNFIYEFHQRAPQLKPMKIAVAGSVARDHLMTFPGKFSDAILPDSLHKLSVSFLVDGLEIRRGGVGANIAFGLGVMGLDPILIASVGKDWEDYNSWLARHGVNTDHVSVSESLYTASFTVTTDTTHSQVASFFPGAMQEARNIELEPIINHVGTFDLLVVSPDDPEAMRRHTQTAKRLGIPFVADPSQQLSSMDPELIKELIDGADFLFLNEYELELAQSRTGWTQEELFSKVRVQVTTLGAEGARIQEHGRSEIIVSPPRERRKEDPTGVGDSFRAGFLAALSWGMNHERCAQVGSLLATYCLENKGTQEYRFTRDEFLSRFEESYGREAALEIEEHFRPNAG